MSEDLHSLGSFNGDFYYMKVNDFDVVERVVECDFEIYKNDDPVPVLTIKEELPENIIKDIEDVINKLRNEHDSRFDDVDYEGYKLREQERKRVAQEAWLLRNSIG